MKRNWVIVMLAAAILALCTGGGLAACHALKGERIMLSVGAPAPDIVFSHPLDDGTEKLSDYRGKKNVVLAFYPKAFTPHCTQQMCGYRDSMNAFKEADTVLIGISLDTPDKSRAFKEHYHLPFPVVADPDRAIVRTYGVPVMNLIFVKMAKRSVFLIDKEGTFRYINRSYNITRDEPVLLDEVKRLAPGS